MGCVELWVLFQLACDVVVGVVQMEAKLVGGMVDGVESFVIHK